MKRVHLRISGDVQGVGFRYAAQRRAEALRVAGWVRNQRDGTVEAEVEGPEDAVESFVAWAHHGPSGAQVTDVEENSLPTTGEQGFDIAH